MIRLVNQRLHRCSREANTSREKRSGSSNYNYINFFFCSMPAPTKEIESKVGKRKQWMQLYNEPINQERIAQSFSIASSSDILKFPNVIYENEASRANLSQAFIFCPACTIRVVTP